MIGTWRRLGLGIALVGLWAGSATPMLAEDTGTVDVSISVASPCIVVSPNIVDLGTLPIGDLSGTDTAVSIYNCSVAAERVYGRTTDAVGQGVTWTPADFGFDPETQEISWCPGVGLNRYAAVVTRPATPAREIASLALVARELEVVQPDGTGNYDRLGIAMPCAGSDGGGAVMSFTVTFTASF